MPSGQQQQQMGIASSVPQQSPFNSGYNTQLNSQLPLYSPSPLLGNLYSPPVETNQWNPFNNVLPSIKLLKEKEKDKKVVAIIVTFHSEMSYDTLFSTV